MNIRLLESIGYEAKDLALNLYNALEEHNITNNCGANLRGLMPSIANGIIDSNVGDFNLDMGFRFTFGPIGLNILSSGHSCEEIGYTPKGIHAAVIYEGLVKIVKSQDELEKHAETDLPEFVLPRPSTIFDAYDQSILAESFPPAKVKLKQRHNSDFIEFGAPVILSLARRFHEENYLFQEKFDRAPWYNPQVQ